MIDVNRAEIREAIQTMRPRPFFGRIMIEFAKADKDVLLVVADSGQACRCKDYIKECPDQFVECGICEQNMISVAAGLAQAGKKPIAFAFAPFASERCFEQIRLDVAYAGTNVIIVGSEAGVSMGTQGVTHYGWDDAGAIRSLAGMTVMQPADNLEMVRCIEAALAMDGPVYIRLSGGKGPVTTIYNEDMEFEIGKAVVHSVGTDANIVAAGSVLKLAMDAAELLKAEGISVGVADMHTFKPIDECAIKEMASSAKLMVTVEEHSVINGLGTAVADVLAANGSGCRLVKIGLPDEYPHRVSPFVDMMKQYNITVEGIAEAIRNGVRK